MAFPTTGVLDTFSGTLGSWTTGVFGDAALTITGGAVTSSTASYGSGVWTASFGPDMEVYLDIPTHDSDDMGLAFRVQDTSSSLTAYVINWQGGSGAISVDRYVSGTPTNVTTGTQALADGDAVGASIIGSAIKVYYKASGGSWAQVISTSDGGITGTGQIGCSFNGSTWRGDNFGGGTVVTGANQPVPRSQARFIYLRKNK